MSHPPANEYDVEYDIPPASLLPDMVNDLIGQAVIENATDIHLDPVRHDYVLRFRVDGLVHEKGPLTRAEGRRLINQVKVASRLDIERLYMPIEGQFRWGSEADGRDIRVTMVPTFEVEALHLRLLVRPDESRDVEQLGMTPEDHQNVLTALRHPHGLVLVSGVTGAGKTTTLYAMARARHLAGRVIMSIEDPVEFDLDYVRQLQVDEERGLTMAAGLRVLLRMDPDVLLVGEVRDTPSAVTAARAAQAGRLVMATIHARDAAAALDTLQYLSVPDYVIGGALRLIVSQNLVRRLCKQCARPRELRAHERVIFEEAGIHTPRTLHEAVGCEACHDYGYDGRVGVFDVVVVDDELGEWLSGGPTQHEIRRKFEQIDHRGFIDDALRKAANGVTSMDEVLQFFGEEVDRPVALDPTLEPRPTGA